MDDWKWVIELASKWKELGALGACILILAKIGARFVDWFLEVLGINIKRGQSREDLLIESMEALRIEFNDLSKRFTKIEGAYEVTAGIAHQCADGIEKEMTRAKIESPTILFFVSQLRAVQRIEDVLKD